jgi:hypothetical protein
MRHTAREPATTRCFSIRFFLECAATPAILSAAAIRPCSKGIRHLARQRQTTADRLRLVVEATERDAEWIGGRACDPRLADLVRLLARQAARDFVQAEAEAQGRTGSKP